MSETLLILSPSGLAILEGVHGRKGIKANSADLLVFICELYIAEEMRILLSRRHEASIRHLDCRIASTVVYKLITVLDLWTGVKAFWRSNLKMPLGLVLLPTDPESPDVKIPSSSCKLEHSLASNIMVLTDGKNDSMLLWTFGWCTLSTVISCLKVVIQRFRGIPRVFRTPQGVQMDTLSMTPDVMTEEFCVGEIFSTYLGTSLPLGSSNTVEDFVEKSDADIQGLEKCIKGIKSDIFGLWRSRKILLRY
ncbi:hypothetical protein CPB84DRAFT_1745535 [Gymnopilus junonius]|uniref:Uncharacterized protein n=1 Tax=Gymnopilus junonius TaxID=109634 RepID=A0A9P5TQN3_GYMJU|nr:hypothetical protein CPB84DRAFT_1745535 [Gymnopilus junonius]